MFEGTACIAVSITFCGAVLIFISSEFVQWEVALVKAHSNFPGAVEVLPVTLGAGAGQCHLLHKRRLKHPSQCEYHAII